eukprot:jgi/Chlat1/3957/Chrsp26S08869
MVSAPIPAASGSSNSIVTDPAFWGELLDMQDAQARGRASMSNEARVLRRKGHLKEQDQLIEFMISMHKTHTPMEVMVKMEKWMREHVQDQRSSRLKQLVPAIGKMHNTLKLTAALEEYDEFASLSRRLYVPPNFAEIRHVLNIAQVHASADTLKLITFDADGTLYADGAHFQHDNAMIGHIIALLRSNVRVAIVTAAGYPGEAARFEARLAGLLAAFKALALPEVVTDLFYVMGGECNYLLKYSHATGHLAFVPDELWKTEDMLRWKDEDIQKILAEAEGILTASAARLRLDCGMVRKERCVGIIPSHETTYEVLEDIALAVQTQLDGMPLPFCAFNGGNDVFVDIGNKSIGLKALMQFLRCAPHEALHCGDRFTISGNDNATRNICAILWVANPEETAFYTLLLLRDIRKKKLNPYLE